MYVYIYIYISWWYHYGFLHVSDLFGAQYTAFFATTWFPAYNTNIPSFTGEKQARILLWSRQILAVVCCHSERNWHIVCCTPLKHWQCIPAITACHKKDTLCHVISAASWSPKEVVWTICLVAFDCTNCGDGDSIRITTEHQVVVDALVVWQQAYVATHEVWSVDLTVAMIIFNFKHMVYCKRSTFPSIYDSRLALRWIMESRKHCEKHGKTRVHYSPCRFREDWCKTMQHDSNMM